MSIKIPERHKEFQPENLRRSLRYYKKVGNNTEPVSGKSLALLLSRLIELETFLLCFTQPMKMVRMKGNAEGKANYWRQLTDKEQEKMQQTEAAEDLVFETLYRLIKPLPGTHTMTRDAMLIWYRRLSVTDPEMAQLIMDILQFTDAELIKTE